jgi:hypothetical protein
LFEYASIRNSRCSTLSAIHGENVPRYVPVVLAEATIDKTARKIWHLFDKCLGGNPCVITVRDKKLVLVEDVQLVDQREIFIPAKLTVGLQIEKELIKGWRDPIGESRLYGFIKPCLDFTEGELQPPSFLIGNGKRRHDFPIGVIESGAKVVDGITTNNCCPVYDGFVSFSEGGTSSSLRICFEHVGERSLLLKKYIQLGDVFRGPINLETSAIRHGNVPTNAEVSGLRCFSRRSG